MTGFVLNITGLVLNMTEIILNMTGFDFFFNHMGPAQPGVLVYLKRKKFFESLAVSQDKSLDQ